MTSSDAVWRCSIWTAGIGAIFALAGCSGAGESTDSAAEAILADADAESAALAACPGPFQNKGQCVRCVAHALNDLKAQGEITGAQHGALVSALGKDYCGTPGVDEGCDEAVDDCGQAETCAPLTCEALGANCGTISDGCGGTLDCGVCSGLLTCGAGGTPNVCGCDVAPEICDGIDRNCDGRWDTEVPSICPTIQSALDVATLPGTIHVAPGVYHENVNFMGAPVTVIATGGPDVTVIDAGNNGSAVTINQGEGSLSVLDGFTLTNGTGAPGFPAITGGGLYVANSSPTLRNLFVTDNTVASDLGGGAGAYIAWSNVTIEDSVFTGNRAAYYGGGLYLDNSDVTLNRVIIDENAAIYGGGIALYYGSVAVTNGIFSRNQGYSGNGAFIQLGTGSFTNVSMVENTGGVGGAISAYGGATVALANVTMSGGGAWLTTGGAYAEPGSAITFDHCNFWNNENGDVGNLPDPIGASGNISVDPGFVDTSALLSLDWNLNLAPASLLRNAGTPALQNHDGTPSDIGAYGGPGGNW